MYRRSVLPELCQSYSRSDPSFGIDLWCARDHCFDIQVISVRAGNSGCTQRGGEREALHKTSGESGLHGQNYDIRGGINKKCPTIANAIPPGI